MATLDKPTEVYGATLTRRHFVKTGGALCVGVALTGFDLWKTAAEAAGATNSLDATRASSWIEIHGDNTILFRTGKADFGQGSVTTAYKQIVAEELYVPFEAITTVVTGDTDRTPDGGGSTDFMGRGMLNLRKAAAYTHQALLDLAATRFGIQKSQLSVKDGIVSGAGKSISYGQLVQGEQLNLTIPVSGSLTAGGVTVLGDPPLKPVGQYNIVGKSYPNVVTTSKVTANEVWVTDVRLAGMLHARVVHPKTLGSTLVSVGELNRARFPNAQIVVTGNLVGVLAPTEWEAIQAAQQVSDATKWTDWKGLPGHANLFKWMREEADWKSGVVSTSEKSKGNVETALATAAKKLNATYQLPYMKHASMGPTIAVADVRSDGTVYVYTHTQNAQELRKQIAQMLGTSVDHVVVRLFAGAGHYGRSNGGNAGAEDEAVILSKAVGRPVRVQWTRADDLQWSTSSAAGYADVQLGLDANGHIVGFEVDHQMFAMQDDRLVGAVLAGLPTIGAPDVKGPDAITNPVRDPWLYDRVSNVAERARGTFQLGQRESPIAVGMRDHSMRTPRQFPQNFAREAALNEAAALAGVDAIQFRLDHTADERLIGVLKAVREASGWESRPSPSPAAAPRSSTPVLGRGVSVMLRRNGYWACVCQVSVTPSTGKVTITKYTIAVDPGIVVNPLQLKRQVEGGAVMGMSHALHEEVTFDQSGITNRDWRTYPILTMGELPEMNVVLINRPNVDGPGHPGQGSESANAIAPSAIVAALFDATGKIARRLPLKPAYVQTLLKA